MKFLTFISLVFLLFQVSAQEVKTDKLQLSLDDSWVTQTEIMGQNQSKPDSLVIMAGENECDCVFITYVTKIDKVFTAQDEKDFAIGVFEGMSEGFQFKPASDIALGHWGDWKVHQFNTTSPLFDGYDMATYVLHHKDGHVATIIHAQSDEPEKQAQVDALVAQFKNLQVF